MSDERAAVLDQHHFERERPKYLQGSHHENAHHGRTGRRAPAGCQNQAFNERGRARHEPIGSGLQYTQTRSLPCIRSSRATSPTLLPVERPAGGLFKDARAINIGDILTVDIRIDDKASFERNGRSRKNSSGFTLGASGQSQTSDFAWSGDLEYGSTPKLKATANRAFEKLRLLVAAV